MFHESCISYASVVKIDVEMIHIAAKMLLMCQQKICSKREEKPIPWFKKAQRTVFTAKG